MHERVKVITILMNDAIQNKIHIDKMWGLFIGRFNDNILHRHYALQIGVSSQAQFEITDENNDPKFYKTCFINSNIRHRFESKEISLIILINPISNIGHQLYNKYHHTQITNMDAELKGITDIFNTFLKDRISFAELIEQISFLLTDFKCNIELERHFTDDRIYKAIQYLEKHFDRIVSLEEIASFCFLSETRFLHLFKEKTNLNFRRYQLWNKLIKSLPYLKTHSITETAHQFGFTDSSHYCRTFKETFGLTPKFISLLD